MQNVYTRDALVRGSFSLLTYGGIQYGYTFRFTTQDTRGIYLSCLEDFRVELDGVQVSPYDMTIRLHSGEYAVSEMPFLGSVVIDLGEAATIKVRDYRDLSGDHVLRLSFNDRVCFIGHTGQTIAEPTVDEMVVRI